MATEILKSHETRPDWIYMAQEAGVRSVKITHDVFDVIRAPTYPNKKSRYYYEMEQQPCPKIEWVEESGRVVYAYLEPPLYRLDEKYPLAKERKIEINQQLFIMDIIEFIKLNKDRVVCQS